MAFLSCDRSGSKPRTTSTSSKDTSSSSVMIDEGLSESISRSLSIGTANSFQWRSMAVRSIARDEIVASPSEEVVTMAGKYSVCLGRASTDAGRYKTAKDLVDSRRALGC